MSSNRFVRAARPALLVPFALALALALALAGCGSDGDGDGDTTTGPVEETPVETAVGAAYPYGIIRKAAPDRQYVLIDRTGTRFVIYDRAAGTFTAAQDVSALEGGCPLATIHAAAPDSGDRILFVGDDVFTVRTFHQATGVFGEGESIDTRLAGLPLPSIGAMFTYGSQLFLFNAGGISYTALSFGSGAFSPVYSFTGDFGGGDAPIAAVGAAVVLLETNEILLFDVPGKQFTIYSNGAFTPAYPLDQLGDGSLAF